MMFGHCSKIRCNRKIRNWIYTWMRYQGWEPDIETFADLLQQTRVEMPVRITNIVEVENYEAILHATSGGTSISIDIEDKTIYLNKGDINEEYLTYLGGKKEGCKPIAKLIAKNYNRNGKELKGIYVETYNLWRLKQNDRETEIMTQRQPKFCWRVCEEVEEKLLEQEEELGVEKLYEQLVMLLSLSTDDILRADLIQIKISVSGETREILKFYQGKMDEFAVRSNGDTYHLFFNSIHKGDWVFLSEDGNIKITYHNEKNRYEYAISGDEKILTEIDIERIKIKMSELREEAIIKYTYI